VGWISLNRSASSGFQGGEIQDASFGIGDGYLVVSSQGDSTYAVYRLQDGDNAPQSQNFKLVSWAEVRRVLGLP
jgi:myo-inositol-hexaphosphate 3-phosphohydrolase